MDLGCSFPTNHPQKNLFYIFASSFKTLPRGEAGQILQVSGRQNLRELYNLEVVCCHIFHSLSHSYISLVISCIYFNDVTNVSLPVSMNISDMVCRTACFMNAMAGSILPNSFKHVFFSFFVFFFLPILHNFCFNSFVESENLNSLFDCSNSIFE